MDGMIEIGIDDERVNDALRGSSYVRKKMKEGCKLYWDDEARRVRLIKPSDGKLHRVTVKNAFPKQEPKPETRRDRLVRKFRQHIKHYQDN